MSCCEGGEEAKSRTDGLFRPPVVAVAPGKQKLESKIATITSVSWREGAIGENVVAERNEGESVVR